MKSWIGEQWITDDGDTTTFTQDDYNFLFPTQKGADWATFPHYAELFKKHGYEGVRFWETYNKKATGLFEGDVPVWDEAMDPKEMYEQWKQARINLRHRIVKLATLIKELL